MSEMDQSFLTEYSSDAAVQKYTPQTAGLGISYLLDHEYGPIYRRALRNHLGVPIGDGVRILEFGCGAGMNLIHCLGMLKRESLPVAAAYGTDFSERLILEARKEIPAVPKEWRERVGFCVARNETLSRDLAAGLNVPTSEIRGSFHLILGVNTFRYPYRLGKGVDCAREIYDLLKPGGVCVMIDMNNKFPMFRTLVRDRLTRPAAEYYLPKLEEYAAPFVSAGLDVLERRTFCWIPHSAGTVLLPVCRALTPVLNAVVPSFAMRSLIVARRPV